MTPINIIYPPSMRSSKTTIRTNPFVNQFGSTKVYRKADEFDVDLEPDVIPDDLQNYLNQEAGQNAKDVKQINKQDKQAEKAAKDAAKAAEKAAKDAAKAAEKAAKQAAKANKTPFDWSGLLNGIFGSSNSGSETVITTNDYTPKSEEKTNSKVWIYVGVGVGLLFITGIIIAVVKTNK